MTTLNAASLSQTAQWPRSVTEQKVLHTDSGDNVLVKKKVGNQVVLPDFRFEQAYLRTIRTYVRIPEERPRPSTASEQASLVRSATSASSYESGASEIDLWTDIQWAKVANVTFRDQVIMPLLQGFLFGVGTIILRPYLAGFWTGLRGIFSPSSAAAEGGPVAAQAKKAARDGSAVNWLRSSFRGLLGAVQTEVVLSK